MELSRAPNVELLNPLPLAVDQGRLVTVEKS
jgi:hypothetical protein